MNCPLCKGEMKNGFTSVLIQRNESTIVISNVPALVCEQCGDECIDINISRKIEQLLKTLESECVKTGFVDFSKAA